MKIYYAMIPLVFAGLLVITDCRTKKLSLVEYGKSEYSNIIPENPNKSEKRASELLQKFIEEISDFRLDKITIRSGISKVINIQEKGKKKYDGYSIYRSDGLMNIDGGVERKGCVDRFGSLLESYLKVRLYSPEFGMIPKTLPVQNPRKIICLNGVWDFTSNADKISAKVIVPGTYAGLRQSWGNIHWDVWDYPEIWQDKGGTYSTTFILSGEENGRRVTLKFDGVFQHATYYVNGRKTGESHDGYAPVEMEITPFITTGKNVLSVVITDEGSWLYGDKERARGIWQDVSLILHGEITVEPDVFVKTSVQNSTLSLDIPLKNRGAKPGVYMVRNYITDATGATVLYFDSSPVKLAGQQTENISCSTSWKDPHLWFPHDPYLYWIHTVIYDEAGKILDKKTIRFGFREITWKGPHIYINGRELYLRGEGGHNQGDIQGTRAYLETWMTQLKKYGVNFMRLHNDPKHSIVYEVADEVGMLLEAEAAFFFHVPADTAFAYNHLSSMVKTRRNHPSVFLWSVSNELRWYGGGERCDLINLVHLLDNTRPVFSSDFTIESKCGDFISHHYNPETVFEEWEKYGPDKPLIWDELGSVWQPTRPCYNGTAGYEMATQDYATGMWRDGFDQICEDVNGMIFGGNVAGRVQRPNAFLPWDLTYTFFRWPALNKNRDIPQRWDSVGGPGMKPQIIHPFASTVNLWDPTLPVMEPNPGYWIFAKHFKPVRIYDTDELTSFYSHKKISKHSLVCYDDLRPADFISCRVEDRNGKILTAEQLPVNLIPGQSENITATFTMPEVAEPVSAWLVREFMYKGVPGYKDSLLIRIFPEPAEIETLLQNKKTGVWESGNIISAGLKNLGIHFERITNLSKIQKYDILICDETAPQPRLDAFMMAGGKILQIVKPVENIYKSSGPDTNDARKCIAENTIIEKFETKQTGTLMLKSIISKNTDFEWFGWSEESALVKFERKELVDQHGMLTFDLNPDECSYALAEFKTHDTRRYLTNMDSGKIILEYLARIPDAIIGRDFQPQDLTHRFRILMQDAAGYWYLSDSANAITIPGKTGNLTVSLKEMKWQKIYGRFVDALHVENGYAKPDFSKVYGAGLYLEKSPVAKFGIAISRFQLIGESLPSARIPANGSKHVLLTGIDQPELTHWRNGSALKILPLPLAGRNYRNILAGNKDGDGSALYEMFRGKGIQVITSLNLFQSGNPEPAASQFFANALVYMVNYSTAPPAKTGLIAGESIARFFSSTGLIHDRLDIAKLPDLSIYSNLIIDGADTAIAAGLSEATGTLTDFVNKGGNILACSVNELSLPAFRTITGKDLQLTAPFLDEKRFCIKAPVSWTLRDSPFELVEYYDGILIPRPLEPNFDPLLTGIANKDLCWDGTEMFSKGIEIKGMDPLDVNEQYTILVSNWRIDWSNSGGWSFWGEYSNAVKDVRQAYWFLNRDAVVFKVSAGKGSVIFCQLNLQAGKEKIRRFASQFLTGIGCSIGTPTGFAPGSYTFDLSLRNDQLTRFNVIRSLQKPVTRTHFGPSEELNKITPINFEEPDYPQ